MTIVSTVNTVNLSGLTAQNGNYFNLINYSGGQYNIITTGLLSNYLNNNTLLTPFYTNINGLNRWIAPSYYVVKPDENMIINIVTTTPNTIMSLPFGGISSLNVNWGNGLSSIYTTTPSTTYSAIGSYSISISGYATSFGSIDNQQQTGYVGNNLISTVSEWGKLGITSLAGAFNGASNLLSLPSTLSQYVTNISYMFFNAYNFNNSSISNWNTINITNMEYMFNTAQNFNQNISSWNTSNVTNMNSMFQNATAFDKDISPWSTLNVTNMNSMFQNADVFNQNISLWNVSRVTTMQDMFDGANVFDQNISPWNTSNVINMSRMFSGAATFNRNLSGWNVSNVTNANNIFCNCPGMLATPANRPIFSIPYISSCS
jgi:surface protein